MMHILTFYLILLLATIFCTSCNKTFVGFVVNNPDSPEAPAKFSFANQSDVCEEYTWDFGDGQQSNEVSPEHIYLLSGNYTVSLKGRNGKKIKESQKEIVVKAPEKCLVQIKTEFGDMLVELFDSTPKHRDNFVKLAEEGFYNDLLFHRVIEGFMIQGGDPKSKGAEPGQPLGMGGPGYQIDAEFNTAHAHTKGAIAAARTGDQVNPQRRSSGSQFYIVQGKEVSERELEMMEQRLGINYPNEIKQQYLESGGTPFLDQQYTVFGKVLEGLEIIDKIAAVEKDRSDRPSTDVSMQVMVIK